MNANAGGNTSAVPFTIPLLFPTLSSGSTTSHRFGPRLPKEWRRKWYRITQEELGAVGLEQAQRLLNLPSEVGEEEEVDTRWTDTDLKRWVTSLIAWQDLPRAHTAEKGESIHRSYSTAHRVALGDRRGGIRIALGTQDGTVFIFEQHHVEKKPTRSTFDSVPMTPSRSANSRHRSASSRTNFSIGSPSSARSGLSYPYDVDGVTSPTMPTATMSDVNASAQPGRISVEMDAEEKLEMQWHAGQDRHSSLNGMMEVLGMHSENTGREGGQGLQRDRHSGSSTPSKKTGKARFEGRKELSVSTKALSDDRLTPTVAIEQAEQPEINVAAKKDSEDEEEAPDKVDKVHAMLSFQCCSPLPIISMSIRQGQDNANILVVLQKDGSITLFTMAETLETHVVHLKTDKVPTFETHSAVETTLAPAAGPLARLAALRSQTGSPAPRSRASSNASLPELTTQLPGVSSFAQVLLSKGKAKASADHLSAYYDSTQKCLSVVDCIVRQLVVRQRLQGIGDLMPCVQLSEDGELVEVFFLTATDDVICHTIRIKSKVKRSLADFDTHAGPLSSVPAFLRREGISMPASRTTSKPASIYEEDSSPDRRDLVLTGLGDTQASGLTLCLGLFIVLWNKKRFRIAKRVGDSLTDASYTKLAGIVSIDISGDVMQVKTSNEIITYRVDSAGFALERDRKGMAKAQSMESSYVIADSSITCSTSDDDRISLACDGRQIWQSDEDEDEAATPSILASLPISMEKVVLSLSSGHLVMSSLNDLVSDRLQLPKAEDGMSFDSQVTLLQFIVDPRDKARMIVGGSEEGDILIWNAATLELRATIQTLNSPIVAFVPFGDQDNVLRLHGCLACVSADSTVAIVDLTDFSLLRLLPGRQASLQLLAARSNDLLTVFDDGRARTWNVKNGDMLSSISAEQANVLLNDAKGWWSRFPIDARTIKREKGASGVLSSVPWSRSTFSGAMTADVRRVIEASGRMVTNAIAGGANVREAGVDSAQQRTEPEAEKVAAERASLVANLTMPQAKKALHTLRPLVLCLVPRHLDEEIDKLLETIFDDGQCARNRLPVLTGTFHEPRTLVMPFIVEGAGDQYCVSSMLSTTALVACVAMLNVLARIEDLQFAAEELIKTLCRLPTIVGKRFRPATMDLLTSYMVDPLLEIKQAAQTLFVASLEEMPQAELDVFCVEYGDQLPSRRSNEQLGEIEEGSEQDLHTSKTLLLLGLIATQRYKDLQPLLLKDIATSIEMYLNDEDHPSRQSVAITLCDRGFSIFQHYFDAMEVVRSFFALSTMVKEPTSISSGEGRPSTPSTNVIALGNRDLARQATMRIAEDNMPLFMTTLSLDILHARSPEHCSATMRLVAFMVRRKPLVLYPNLPRLAEAVVKSLDPTVTTLRSVVHRSATIIISELITAYPTIAFHKALQRLAVGTFEGAIIMYDLKTATRLYVLEAHSTALNGLVFSHDGRRLISMCLGDGILKVWKTGVGIGSLFSFGNAPRQMGTFLSRAAASVAGVAGGGDEGLEGQAEVQDRENGQPNKNHHHHHHEHNANTIRTPSYKSFDFGTMLGPALAEVTRKSNTPRSARTSSSFSTDSTDLSLIRFDWMTERSIRVRIGEASMVFDVA